LLDTDADQINIITFFRVGPARSQRVDSPIDVQRVSADIARGRSTTTISLDLSSPPSGGNFTNAFFYLRGINSTLKVSTSGLTSVNLPRVLSGTNTRTGVSAGVGFFREERFTLAYQELRSIRANDAQQGLVAAVQAISDELAPRASRNREETEPSRNTKSNHTPL
jgi:hypothetical protein